MSEFAIRVENLSKRRIAKSAICNPQSDLVGVVLNAVPTRKGSFPTTQPTRPMGMEAGGESTTGAGERDAWRSCSGCSGEGRRPVDEVRPDGCFVLRPDGVTAAFEKWGEQPGRAGVDP